MAVLTIVREEGSTYVASLEQDSDAETVAQLAAGVWAGAVDWAKKRGARFRALAPPSFDRQSDRAARRASLRFRLEAP